MLSPHRIAHFRAAEAQIFTNGDVFHFRGYDAFTGIMQLGHVESAGPAAAVGCAETLGLRCQVVARASVYQRRWLLQHFGIRRS